MRFGEPVSKSHDNIVLSMSLLFNPLYFVVILAVLGLFLIMYIFFSLGLYILWQLEKSIHGGSLHFFLSVSEYNRFIYTNYLKSLLAAKLYSSHNVFISSLTVTMLSALYAFSPAKANPLCIFPFLAFINARAIQYGLDS